ncbi:MAG: RNA polymerase sigma factor RpoD/SigA [Bacteroidia bacterium]
MRQLKITKQITNRDSKSLEKYLHEIGMLDMIQPQEEVSLAIMIKKGDDHALEKLVVANLRFVVSVSKQYQNQGLSLCDLINEGNLGLIKAAKRFDETRGFKFISYAVWWIRQSILQALAENSRMVRLPLNRIGTLNKINQKVSEFMQVNEREPTSEEIADIMEMQHDMITTTQRLAGRHVSIDAPLEDGEEKTLLGMMVDTDEPNPDHFLMAESLKDEVRSTMNILSDKEKEVIGHLFGIGGYKELSLHEVGHKLELTRERVRQIRESALRKLKDSEECEPLKYYLG